MVRDPVWPGLEDIKCWKQEKNYFSGMDMPP